MASQPAGAAGTAARLQGFCGRLHMARFCDRRAKAGRAQNRPQRDPAAHPILLDADRRGYATSRTWPALVQPDQQPFHDPSVAPCR